MKFRIIIFCLSLVLVSACNNSDMNNVELVERWYKVENGEEKIDREVYWENFDKKIPSKIVEYMQANSIYYEYYSDSLLRTSHIVDVSQGKDTFSTIRYHYDMYNNIDNYVEIEDGKEITVKCELILNPTTHKPTKRNTISKRGSSITKIKYFSDHEVSKTYINDDSLILYSAKYFDGNKNKISLARRHLMFNPPSSDSICYQYEKNQLKKEIKYFNGSLVGYKTYYYENDTLKKVIDKPVDKDEIIYIIKYSKK